MKLSRKDFSARKTGRDPGPFPSSPRKNSRFLVLCIIIIFLLANVAKADSLTLSFLQNSTNNVFQNSSPQDEQISNLAFSFDKTFAPFSFFVEGVYSHLYENPRVSYYVQDFGLDYLHAFRQKTAFYFSLKGSGMFYGSDYSDYNYFSLAFMAAVKTYLSESSIMKLNYVFDFKNYRASVFDFHSHVVALSVDRYFETKTTLKADMTWGHKYFLHPVASLEEAAEVTPSPYQYGGRKRFGFHHEDPSQPDSSVPGISTRGGRIQVFSIAGLIAQGLGEKVGLRISGLQQWTLSGQNPFALVEEFYMVENPTYDLFSWNGYALSGQATVEAPWNTELKIGYTRFEKHFPGIEAMSLDGVLLGMTRRDFRNQWEARLEKNWPSFSLSLSYSYVDNHSNDPFYDWDGHFLSIGFEWGLTW